MRLSPKQITEKRLFFSIPIYQRLFEWDTDNILTLLDDLKKEFVLSRGTGDYYIGMLTSTKNNELVDGQQRFTVMMLLGCVLQTYYPSWKDFLVENNNPRLYFSSRPQDNTYLRAIIEGKEANEIPLINHKMSNGIFQIKDYLKKESFSSEDEIVSFAQYIYTHLSFFISDLPEGYSPRDLNKYFERMNTSGKNLEQHEILKVKLLHNLNGNVEKYMQLWNKLADVDTLLIRRRKTDGRHEDDGSLTYRKNRALSVPIDTIIEENLINGIRTGEQDDSVDISSIPLSSSAPKTERETNKDSRCSLTFPYLLLQSLYRLIKGEIDGRINDFFKPSNLLETFEKYLPYSGVNVNKDRILQFLELLVKSRLALDICFIRPTEYGYSLDMGLNEDDNNLRNLMMFQSMLYVSSSNYTNYRWYNWLMDEVESCGKIPNAQHLFEQMKREDDQNNPLRPYDLLSYGEEVRYWFWRLDFYIWQHRNEFGFGKDSPEMAIIENYVFKRNRSIEHIAPQTPQSNSTFIWKDSEEDKTLRDSFGNLVMISQGLNSALSNESYEIKTAHVQSYMNGAKSGSIESLKLLLVHHDYPTGWTRDTIAEHGQKMYEYLKNSY